jgi:hypothetical protein
MFRAVSFRAAAWVIKASGQMRTTRTCAGFLRRRIYYAGRGQTEEIDQAVRSRSSKLRVSMGRSVREGDAHRQKSLK